MVSLSARFASCPCPARVDFVLLLGIFSLVSKHSVVAEDFVKSYESAYLSSAQTYKHSDVVYPAHGLTTGPPVYVPDVEKETISRTFHLLKGRAADLKDFNNDDSEILSGKLKIKDQRRLQKDSMIIPKPLKGGCISGNLKDDLNHPRVDTVEIYEGLNNMIEHVTGFDQVMDDPEQIRMRAYVGERQNVGVQVILEDKTHFWESGVAGGTLHPTEDMETSTSEDGEWFFPRHEKKIHEQEDNIESDGITQIDITEGSRLRLVCNVTGVPTYWVEWRRGANLSFPGGASVVGARSVLLDYVGREDAGTYSCTATTPSGHAFTSGVTIRVEYPPVVGIWARDVKPNRVEVGCLVEGRPRPTSAWYMNNTKLSPSNCPRNAVIRSSILSKNFVLSVLTLTNLSENDYAYYHCRASSSIGVSRAYLMLHDGSGMLDLRKLAETRPVKHPAPLENPRLSSFLLGMVPPLYIGLYIIAYLGCYKTSISGVGAHGRFGALDLVE